MLDQQDGLAARLQAADDLEHLGGLALVHAGRGFVEQQQPGLERERARDLHAAAVGVREAVGRVIDARRQPFAEQRDDLERLPAQRLLLAPHGGGLHQRERQFGQRAQARHAAHARLHGAQPGVRADQHVVEHREVGEHAPMLEGARQAARGELLRGQARDVLPLEQHLPFVGPVQAGHEVEERGLAGPVGPDHAEQFALAHVQVDRVHGREAAEAAHQAADLKQRRHRPFPAARGRPAPSSSRASPRRGWSAGCAAG